MLISDDRLGLEAVVVVDNVAIGPAIGGLRMRAEATIGEVARLARAMTLKSAMAGLPHGGAKAAIVSEASVELARKESLVRAFARRIADVTDYIPGPDMGTDETAMAWIHDEIGRAVGLPRVLGGIPLDDLGATGFGLAVAADAVAAQIGTMMTGSRAVIQGFGSVGRAVARAMVDRGATVTAVSDRGGRCHAADGIDLGSLSEHKDRTGSVVGCPGTQSLSVEEMVALPCEWWIPAAEPDVFTVANAATVRAAVVLPGANIAATAEAEAILHERGVVVLPDFVVNAGGLICAAVEYQRGSAEQAFARIEQTIGANTIEVLRRALAVGCSPRVAAEAMAREQVEEAMRLRSR